MDKITAQELVKATPHWHHKFEVYPGVVTPGSYAPKSLLDKLRLPARMDGVTVLDVGPSDGYFSMELARRGAKLTCIDYRRKEDHGFAAMEKISGLAFDYHQANVYDLTPQRFGTFDVVLFLGVLYHLADMMKALSVLHSMCKGSLYLESQVDTTLRADMALARYHEGDSLAGDLSNFWTPNLACIKAMCRDLGFQPTRDEAWGSRALVEAKRVPLPYKHQIAYGTLNG